jgi:hypothetical protein
MSEPPSEPLILTIAGARLRFVAVFPDGDQPESGEIRITRGRLVRVPDLGPVSPRHKFTPQRKRRAA